MTSALGRDARTRAIATYAVGTVGMTFLEAIVRLGARALETITRGLRAHEYLALACLVLAFTYLEGHRALARRFVPSVVARAIEGARTHRGCFAVALSPLAALRLLGSDARACLRAWAGVAAIVLAVVTVRALPAPWRGLVDAAVVCALTWGLVALVVTFGRALAALEHAAGDTGRPSSADAGDRPRAPSISISSRPRSLNT